MIVLKIIFYIIAAIFVVTWAASRIAFYINGRRDATLQSFKQFTDEHFRGVWNFINFTDTVIKILAFAALIAYLWQQF